MIGHYERYKQQTSIQLGQIAEVSIFTDFEFCIRQTIIGTIFSKHNILL
jgi:hypothetical protein